MAILLLGLGLGTSASAEESGLVFRAGHENEFLSLGQPFTLEGQLPGGATWTDLEIRQSELSFRILPRGGRENDAVALIARPDLSRTPPTIFDSQPKQLREELRKDVEALQSAISGNATAEFWNRVSARPSVQQSTPATTPTAKAHNSSLLWIGLATALCGLLLSGSKWRWPSTVLLVLGIGFVLADHVLLQRHFVATDLVHLGWAEAMFARHAIGIAGVVLAAALVSCAHLVKRSWQSREARGGLFDAALVLTMTAGIRFGLTRTNVLYEGGIAYTRLLGAVHNYAGLSSLVHLLPGEPTLESAMQVARVLALFTPALVMVIGRLLGLSRNAALLGGVMFACWPLESVLASSSIEEFALTALGLAAMALILAANRFDSPELWSAGTALAAFFIWGRPDGLLLVVPWAALLARTPRSAFRSPMAAGALVWFAGSVALRLWNLKSWPEETAAGFQPTLNPWSEIPWRTFLTTSYVLPLWLLGPALIGWLSLFRKGLFFTVAAIAAGLLPVYVVGQPADPTGSHIELFSYTAFAHPWIALLAGAGVVGLLELVSFRRRIVLNVATTVAAVGLVAFAWSARGYLDREYGFMLEKRTFDAALSAVPEGCGFVVPEDGGGPIMNETRQRYEAWLPRRARSIGTHEFLRTTPHSALPPLPGFTGDAPCWILLRGAYCFQPFEPMADGIAESCGTIQHVWNGTPIHESSLAFYSHRQVTQPGSTPQTMPWALVRLQPRTTGEAAIKP